MPVCIPLPVISPPPRYTPARHVIIEPPGALIVAGMKKYTHEYSLTDQDIVTITSGANIPVFHTTMSNSAPETTKETCILFFQMCPEKYLAQSKLDQ